MKRRALLSVTDKSGIIDLARCLRQANYEVIATSGTAKELRSAGIEVREVSEITGVGEVAGGRVKTLHPEIFAGILATGKERGEIAPIDLVVVNLYDFASSAGNGKFDLEKIDVGGVALIRAAAKNFEEVTLLTSPSQYPEWIESMPTGLEEERRRELAGIGFALTAQYDLAIAHAFAASSSGAVQLRYGENPHQRASILSDGSGIAGARNLSHRNAKPLSYNNLLDGDAAWQAVADHGDGEAVIAIVKHSNPCGIAKASSPRAAFRKALECDPVSSYGGVIASNRKVDVDLAKDLTEIFLEVIVAPGFSDEALEQLQKRENLRILEVRDSSRSMTGAFISGGILIQERDEILGESSDEWDLVAGKAVSESVMEDLRFAWRSVRSVKSNAIVIAKDQATIGIGMGQVSRVDAARLAVARGGDRVKGAVAASDAFFPFADGAMELANAGVVAIVQPGGSKRDNEVIEAMSMAGISMYLTHRRHFSH